MATIGIAAALSLTLYDSASSTPIKQDLRSRAIGDTASKSSATESAAPTAASTFVRPPCNGPLAFDLGRIPSGNFFCTRKPRFSCSADKKMISSAMRGAAAEWNDKVTLPVLRFSQGAELKVDIIVDGTTDSYYLETDTTTHDDKLDAIDAYRRDIGVIGEIWSDAEVPAEFEILRNRRADAEMKIARIQALIDMAHGAGANRANLVAGGYRPGNPGRITISVFEDESDLQSLIAHELGHAMGLPDIDDPKALMSKSNDSTIGEATTIISVDIDALLLVCPNIQRRE